MIKFSIITVTKNAAASLDRCITSVAEQRYPFVEYIIVDGASTDDTAAVVARHRRAVSQYVSESDTGIYNAMNKGLARASGDFIYFLGSDDFLVDSAALEDVAKFLEMHPRCGYAYGSIEVRFQGGRKQLFVPPPPEDALDWLVCQCLPHQSSFATRQTFEIVGGFNEELQIGGDYDWFLRVIAHPKVVTMRFERVVASYFSGGVSTQLERSQKEAYAIQNSFPPYQTPEWLQRRLHIFQKELMKCRIECNQLRARTKTSRLIDRVLSTPPTELPRRLSSYIARRVRARQDHD
jgi:glycosyltransferase involved in cell wall biosynthesis